MPIESALSTPWVFLSPTTSLHANTVNCAKHFLDSLALSVSNAQLARQRVMRKRKRSDYEQESLHHVLQLKELFVQGFTSDQIWEQATRILDSAKEEIEQDSALVAQHVEPAVLDARASPVQSREANSEDVSEFSGMSISSESAADRSDRDSASDDDMEDMESEPESRSMVKGHSDEDSRTDVEESENDNHNSRDTYVQDPFGLNDGFFSIDEFNKLSDFLERQDAKGGIDDELGSDEEEIDWHVNPLAGGSSVPPQAARPTAQRSKSSFEDGSESSSDEEGPTFDNVAVENDLDSEDDDSYSISADTTNWMNTSDIKYSDFFEPPPRKATSMKTRPLPKTQPHGAPVETDIDRAIADVRRDLLEDDGSLDGNDSSDNELGGSKHQHSAHEKQRARIADEIRRLEAANVAKKDWMLAGEARGPERPMNSLIEEDLDFERVGKPVPVVTTELSGDIEELVKRRILAKEFDEVIRRRPGISEGQATKKGRFELEDTKPQQSLVELFETDHLRATDPNYVDPKNHKLLREHTEISNLWKEISDRLDTLSNWHYRPKAPLANINVITDVATIMMEDAQPAASSAVGGSAALAPQEIYAPGDNGKVAGEVTLKNGESVAKDEMTRDEKSKLRRRQKKQRKTGSDPAKQQSGRAAENQQIVSTLKKGGVKVIGREGHLTDVYGARDQEGTAKTGADMLKL
jgi:U3 small nucleolar RNA-associated protein MPP10